MLLELRTVSGNNGLILLREKLLLMLILNTRLKLGRPAVIIDTLAIMGTLASMVNINGVTLVDNINDEIENALSPRTAFDRGP